ncbi:MAG: hypothetical protein HZY76_06150 [Anaerolineae bacterium]|nr:MAG: hypothetical protein HZY76_06150 [Anaerolineae bacterium]
MASLGGVPPEQKGDPYIHQGAVHASDGEMALLLAKEQFTRRAVLRPVGDAGQRNLGLEDDAFFTPATDKSYRESSGYKIAQKLRDLERDL